MARSIFCLILCLSFYASGLAQHSIKGRLLDEQAGPLSHATVALLHPADSTLRFFGVTNDEGAYHVRNVKAGQYLMQYSYVGMQTEYERVDIPAASGENFGDQVLKPSMMDEVIVEAELIPVRFKRDTLEFDVRAFKTRPGAAVEELLQKLPGIEVDETGNIKAEGEDVTRVLVDGKEFFDNDPKVATKNLPAKALKKVQVIDRKSEEALFTGIDDGAREKTINLELKEDHKKGYFGELSAGLGTEDYYKAEGRAYRFSQKTQTAFLGMANNINEFGFTHKGNNQFGQHNKGVSTTLGGGINLSYNPANLNRYFINYLGSRIKKGLDELVSTENFFEAGRYEQFQDLRETETDRPHKINFGVRHNFNNNNRLIVDGDLNVGTNQLFSQSLTNTQLEQQLMNDLQNTTDNASEEFGLHTRATYVSKLDGEKTQLKLNTLTIFNKNTNQLDWTNETRLYDPPVLASAEQFRHNETEHLRITAAPSLVQKLSKSWALTIGATFGINEDQLRRTEGYLDVFDEFAEIPIPDFQARQTFVQPSVDFNRTGLKSQLNLKLDAFTNQFEKVINSQSVDKSSYFYFLPEVSYRNEYRTGRKVNVRYYTDVNMPSLIQLNPVVDSINQLSIFRGNINLKPAYNHHLAATWSLFDQFSFTSLTARLYGNYTTNKIRWSQEIGEDLIQVNTPINVESNTLFMSYVYFATPIRALELNFNMSSREIWSRGLVFINGEENINTNLTHILSLSLENRNSEQISLNVSASINLTDSRFSIAEDQNNVFFNTSFTGNLRYTPNRKWNFQTKVNVLNYNARSFDESVSVPLVTASASYFFLQAEKASLTLSAFDLLNKYIGIQRISDSNFLMQREWNTVGQYVMLSFRMSMR